MLSTEEIASELQRELPERSGVSMVRPDSSDPVEYALGRLQGTRVDHARYPEHDWNVGGRKPNKPYNHPPIVEALLLKYSDKDKVADMLGCSRGTLDNVIRETNIEVGSRRVDWDVEDSWDVAREKCLERDDYTCVCCGKSEDEQFESQERSLTAHHVIPRRYFDEKRNADSVQNLVTLCDTCHHKFEQTPRELFLKAKSNFPEP